MFREKNIPTAEGPPKNSAKPWQGRTLGENEEEEDLADSGRLFVRNLPYTSTEEELEQLFSRYGEGVAPLSAHAAAHWLRAGNLGSSPVCLPSAVDPGLRTSPLASVFSSIKWGQQSLSCLRMQQQSLL